VSSLLEGHAASTGKKQIPGRGRVRLALTTFQALLSTAPSDEIRAASLGESSPPLGNPAEGSGLEACISLLEAILKAAQLTAATGKVPKELSRERDRGESLLEGEQLARVAQEHADSFLGLVRASTTRPSVLQLRAAARREVSRFPRDPTATDSSFTSDPAGELAKLECPSRSQRTPSERAASPSSSRLADASSAPSVVRITRTRAPRSSTIILKTTSRLRMSNLFSSDGRLDRPTCHRLNDVAVSRFERTVQRCRNQLAATAGSHSVTTTASWLSGSRTNALADCQRSAELRAAPVRKAPGHSPSLQHLLARLRQRGSKTAS